MSQRVRRAPARSGSTWLRERLCDEALEGAACKGRQELPWTADYRPDHRTLLMMGETCARCPVKIACAEVGLQSSGGFYAGVWLPWKREKGQLGVRTARRELESRIKFWKIGAVRPAAAKPGHRDRNTHRAAS